MQKCYTPMLGQNTRKTSRGKPGLAMFATTTYTSTWRSCVVRSLSRWDVSITACLTTLALFPKLEITTGPVGIRRGKPTSGLLSTNSHLDHLVLSRLADRVLGHEGVTLPPAHGVSIEPNSSPLETKASRGQSRRRRHTF